jgi:hypothetical protein
VAQEIFRKGAGKHRNADTLYTMSTLSVSPQAHSQNSPICPNALDTVANGTDAKLRESTKYSTDSADNTDPLDDAFSESALVNTDSPDTLDTMSALSAQTRAHSESLSHPLNDAGDPDGPCLACGSGQWRQLPGEPWHCRACEPDMPLTAPPKTSPPTRYNILQ